MSYNGGCHCGKIAFEVEGNIDSLAECNCTICTKHGYLHWFVGNDKLHLKTPQANVGTYTFRTGKYKHHFCPSCGCAPFITSDEGTSINVRCLEGVDPSGYKMTHFDGASL
jgi:hypothetical protein